MRLYIQRGCGTTTIRRLSCECDSTPGEAVIDFEACCRIKIQSASTLDTFNLVEEKSLQDFVSKRRSRH